MLTYYYIRHISFTQDQTVPERAVRKTRPPVPLANLLSCRRFLVSANCERGASWIKEPINYSTQTVWHLITQTKAKSLCKQKQQSMFGLCKRNTVPCVPAAAEWALSRDWHSTATRLSQGERSDDTGWPAGCHKTQASPPDRFLPCTTPAGPEKTHAMKTVLRWFLTWLWHQYNSTLVIW